MADEPQLLFLTDPKRFMEFVANDDSESRFQGLKHFNDLAICEIVRYGIYNREDMIEPLARFYRELVMNAPENQRLEIYRHVAGLVEHTHVSANAFLPFIVEDSSRMIVSSAVIASVSFAPLIDNDPMSTVKMIIGLIEMGVLENAGAAFGGLLNLGDERVCQLLVPIRDGLDRKSAHAAARCGTGFIYAATADFYLDWLESLGGDDQDGVFGSVASGLALLKKCSHTDQVFTGHRPFPVRSIKPEEWKVMTKPISLIEYLNRAASRMYALERSEPPPRVMPHVLTEWGLKPLSTPSETDPLDG